MPRRNRRARNRWPALRLREETASEPLDTDALARQLVKDGKASPLILGHTLHPVEVDLTGGRGVGRDDGSAVDPPLDNFLSLLSVGRP